MANKKSRSAKKSCRPNPRAEAGPRFELINLIADCFLWPAEEPTGVPVRFAVRDSQTGTIHQNLCAIVATGPALGFIQLRESKILPSLECVDSKIISPGDSSTNFSTEECRSILEQLIGQLYQVAELFAFSVLPLGIAHARLKLALIERAFTGPGEPCELDSPERKSIVRQIAPFPEELHKQSGLPE